MALAGSFNIMYYIEGIEQENLLNRVNHTVCIGMYGTVYVGHRFIQYYGLHRGYSTRKLIK